MTEIDLRRLAAALKTMRLRSGKSTASLAQDLGWSQSMVSRIENGRRHARVAEAAAWADATNADDRARAELLALAEAVGAAVEVRSWWDLHARGLARRQHEIAELEGEAGRIRNCQPVVPGLLQTADYAHKILTLSNVTGQRDLGGALTARLARQAVLQDTAKRFDYVLPESALRWRPSADPTVMRAQGDRLLAVSQLPNVDLAILPFSVVIPIVPLTGFVLYEIPGEPIVLLETVTDEVIFGAEREITAYREAFAKMRAAAVAGAEARALIHDVMITAR
ncbi:MAG TPA: helix-turn-helix transcriptional regulator [Streptosporangiaceae bacterium]|nr:helix-turn-helix transcriptional regulator [Streptosporangiaceae bacterium]